MLIDNKASNNELNNLNSIDSSSIHNRLKSKQRLACPYDGCDCSFLKNCRLKAHIRMHHTHYLPFVCTETDCKAAFASQTYLNKHLLRHEKKQSKSDAKNVNRNKSHRCENCSNKPQFRDKHQLRLHQGKCHGAELPFRCEECGKSFPIKSRLTTHQRRHRGYRCSYPDCKFQCDKWSVLRKHLANDHCKLECSVCRKTYSSSYNLRIHEQTVHREQFSNVSSQTEFACPYQDCCKTYLRESSLKTHIRTNHCEPKHVCQSEGCTKRFRHKKSLDHHVKMEHSVDAAFKPANRKRKNSQPIKTNKTKPRFKSIINTNEFDDTDRKVLFSVDQLVGQPEMTETQKISINDLRQSNLFLSTVTST